MKTLSESDKEFICDIKAPCFQKLIQEEVELIKKSKTQVFFRRGENLTKEGTFASYVLFIIDGCVKLYLEGPANRNYNLQVLQSGDFIGLSVVFHKNKFIYSTAALRETKAFLIEREAIEILVKQNGQFAFSIIKRYCEQETMLYESLRKIMYKQMNGRLADTLLYLGSDTFIGEGLFSYLSRKEIADFAGMSTESTVKLLKVFEKDGLIKLGDKNIEIRNPAALNEISKKG